MTRALELASLVVAEFMEVGIEACRLSDRRGREEVEAATAALAGEAFGATSATGAGGIREGECRALSLGRRIFNVGVASGLRSTIVAEAAGPFAVGGVTGLA